jgi:polar amino acid transport system permease protein
MTLALDFDSDVVRFLFNEEIRKGARMTIQVAVLAQVIGVVLGLGFAVMRASRNPLPRFLAGFYVWFFRGTPVLLQLYIFYFGIPAFFNDQTLTNEITKFRAAVIAFGINEGAYMTEIIRGGMLSVESGQMDAARSLGMTICRRCGMSSAPGLTRRHPTDRQRVHRDAEEYVAGVRYRVV